MEDGTPFITIIITAATEVGCWRARYEMGEDGVPPDLEDHCVCF
jgi:hypothetical protein